MTISRIGGGRTPADSRKTDEADRGFAEVFEFGAGVDAQALRGLVADVRLSRHCNAIEPGQRLLDFLRLEAHR
jgi:hypothetical protein